jgi:hypothetical protein
MQVRKNSISIHVNERIVIYCYSNIKNLNAFSDVTLLSLFFRNVVFFMSLLTILVYLMEFHVINVVLNI